MIHCPLENKNHLIRLIEIMHVIFIGGNSLSENIDSHDALENKPQSKSVAMLDDIFPRLLSSKLSNYFILMTGRED